MAPALRSIQITTRSDRPPSSRPSTIRSAKRPAVSGAFTAPDYTRAAVGLVDAIKGAFSFLSTRSQAEDRIAQYIIREHHRGRPLAEILNDHYVTNRMTPEPVKRLLDRPEVIHELGDDLISDARLGSTK